MSDYMDAREVKKVIEASIFNPSMRKDAKDFIDAQAERIVKLEAYVESAKEWFGNFCVHAPIQFGGEVEMAEEAEVLLKGKTS